jgi:hypothetical protein
MQSSVIVGMSCRPFQMLLSMWLKLQLPFLFQMNFMS